MSQKQELQFNDATIFQTTWMSDEIRLAHNLANYKKHEIRKGSSDTDPVQLHFGLKGDYSVSYKQLNRSFDLVGGHHNIFYSNGFDMEFLNKTLTIETFGIQFPKELFLRFTENANDPLKRFADKIMSGESGLFSDTWGSIQLPIQQAINQIIHNQYSGGMQDLFLLSKSIELLVLSAEACIVADNKVENILKQSQTRRK